MSLVSPQDLDRLGPRARLRLGVEILAAYVRARLAMRDPDAQRVVEALRARARERARTEGEPCAPELQLVVGWRLGHAVAATLRPLPTDSRCLAQSLTLLSVLERRGIEQTLVIAARPRPFAAHAWVEVGGQPMLPVADPGYERLTVL